MNSTNISSSLSILKAREHECQFSSKHKTYVYTSNETGRPRKVRGITKLLMRRFWDSRNNKGLVSEIKKLTRKSMISGNLFISSSRMDGTRVHEVLNDIVRKFRFGNVNSKPIVVPSRVSAIVKYMKNRKITPLYSEYCVYDSVNGIGTGADLIVRTNEGLLCLIEIKTGYCNASEYSHILPSKPYLRDPLSFIEASLHTLHSLQLVTTAKLFKMWGIEFDRHEIWLVNDNVTAFNADSRVITRMDEVYALVRNVKIHHSES